MSLEELGDLITEGMKKKMMGLLTRKPKKKRPDLSLSSAGKCQRQAMYRILGTEQQVWSWRMRIALEDGDFAHDQLRGIMRKTFRTRSHFKLVDEEKSVYLNVSGRKIGGHIDGLIIKLCDCLEHKSWPRKVLLEVRSTGHVSYGYAVGGKISEDYLAQATAYMAAMDIEDCLFLFKNKSNGEFRFIPYKRDDKLLKEIFDRYKRILAFKRGGTNLPREYGPTDKGRLPFQCNYCPYVMKCWKEYKPRKIAKGVQVYQLSTDMMMAPDISEVLDEEAL